LLNGTIFGSFFYMAFWASYRFCISSQKVLLPPKAAARRKDISAVIADRQLSIFSRAYSPNSGDTQIYGWGFRTLE